MEAKRRVTTTFLVTTGVVLLISSFGVDALARYTGYSGDTDDVGDLVISGAIVLRDVTVTVNGFDTRLIIFEAQHGSAPFVRSYHMYLASRGWRPDRPGVSVDTGIPEMMLVRGSKVVQIMVSEKQPGVATVVLRVRERGAKSPAAVPGYLLREHLLPVPVFPGTVYGTYLEQGDVEKEQVVGLYQTVMPVDVVRRFYQRALKADGWEEPASYLFPPQWDRAGATLVFTRDGMRLLLNVYEEPGHLGSNVMVVLQTRGRDKIRP